MRLLALAVSVAVGACLMIALNYTLGAIAPIKTAGNLFPLILMGLFIYFLTGFIAGFLGNWKGTQHGLLAGMFVWISSLYYSLFAFGSIKLHPNSSLFALFIWALFIAGIIAGVIGALGGYVGEEIRERSRVMEANSHGT